MKEKINPDPAKPETPENSFKIDNETFEIEQSYLDAILDDEEEEKLTFGLIIEGEKVNDDILPYIETEVLLKIKKNEIKIWQDIAGKTIEWTNYSKNHNRPYAKFLNFGKKTISGYLYNAKIEFENIYNKIFAKIKALCDVKSKTISLDIKTEVKLRAIYLGKAEGDEQELRKIVNSYLNMDDFRCIKEENGNIKFVPELSQPSPALNNLKL